MWSIWKFCVLCSQSFCKFKTLLKQNIFKCVTPHSVRDAVGKSALIHIAPYSGGSTNCCNPMKRNWAVSIKNIHVFITQIISPTSRNVL